MTAEEVALIRQLIEKMNRLEKRVGLLDTMEGASGGSGAVDSVNGQTGAVVLDQDDVGDGTTYKQYSATEQTKLAGIEAGADVTDAGNVGTAIDGATGKTTPVDADTMPLIDSAASNVLKKVTLANIKATLKTYFDTLYNLYVHPNHSGDVTSAGDGATTIANDAVTYAKMQNIATDSLIGRDTASTGDPETISLNATLSMTGAGALQRAALTGDVTASAGSNATTIANDAVTNAKAANMAQATIKGRQSGTGTGDPEDLTAANVRTIINVADGANAYTHPNHSGDVTSTGDGATVIGSNKVLTAMIADAQVTLAKMANLAQATIIGRASGAGTGVPTALSAAQVVAIIQSSIDHGGLTGLGDDDHTQYHNDTRGDARYGRLSTTNTWALAQTFTSGIILGNETLSVYDEGTWTPTLRFGGATTGITYTTRVGKYTRIGNRVWLHCAIALSNKGSATGTADISGLPFTVGQSANNTMRWITMATAYLNMFIIPSSGGTTAAIRALTAVSTDAGAAITDTAFNNTSQLIFEATYEI